MHSSHANSDALNLIKAAAEPNLFLIEEILKNNNGLINEIVEYRDSSGPVAHPHSALSIAVKYQHSAVVKLLLEHNASIEAPLGKFFDSHQPK